MIIRAIKKKIELSKAGSPFARVLVQFDEYRDGKGNYVWISGFGNKSTWLWKVGDDVQPEVTENGKYLNFSFQDEKENKLDVYSMPATIGFVIGLLGQKPTQAVASNRPNSISAPPEEIPFYN